MTRTSVVAVVVGLVAAAATAAVLELTATAAADAGPPDRTVIVVDRTQGSWGGIEAAVNGWSRSPLVELERDRRCHADRFCIVIQKPSDYARDWIGYRDPVARHVSLIQLNAGDDRADQPRIRRWIACHEIGHALGLEHVSGKLGSGCIVDDETAPTTPTPFDLHRLEQTRKAHSAPPRTALRFIYGDAGA